MAILGEGQKPDIMPHYPHLMTEDTEVWTKFLESRVAKIMRVWYDVRVGGMVFLGPEASDMDRRIAAGVTRKRIDVIALVEGVTWVVEIKPFANMYAVGQIITYVRLFSEEYEFEGTALPVIVCDSFDDDLREEFDELGILVLTND